MHSWVWVLRSSQYYHVFMNELTSLGFPSNSFTLLCHSWMNSPPLVFPQTASLFYATHEWTYLPWFSLKQLHSFMPLMNELTSLGFPSNSFTLLCHSWMNLPPLVFPQTASLFYATHEWTYLPWFSLKQLHSFMPLMNELTSLGFPSNSFTLLCHSCTLCGFCLNKTLQQTNRNIHQYQRT